MIAVYKESVEERKEERREKKRKKIRRKDKKKHRDQSPTYIHDKRKTEKGCYCSTSDHIVWGGIKGWASWRG